MGSVADILAEKGHEVLRVAPTASVREALERMVEANVGSLLVGEGDAIVGIVTERDYLRRVALQERDEKTTLVGEVMTTPIVYVTPETGVDECMALMTEKRIRHLPVLDGDTLVGLVSIGDLVKFQSREQSFQIRVLTDYITAR